MTSEGAEREQLLTRLARSHGVLRVTVLISVFAVILSAVFCYTAYALIDPSLFDIPVAVWMPVAAPCFAAPPIAYESVRSRVLLAEAQDAARRRAAELAAVVEEKDRVLSLIGHDLAGHIALVTGFSDEVKKMPPDDPRRDDFIAEIGQAGRAANDMLGDLLAWGRLSLGASPLAREDADLRAIVDRALSLMRTVAAARGVTLTAVGPNVHANVDPRQVETALRNLLANAVRHTPHGGRVATRIETRDTDTLMLSVSDTGPGFDETRLAAARNGTASGLGLAICREVADRHGGFLSVDNDRGAGATVSLVLPFSRTDARP